ncbi:MAG: glycosyltransferase family 39 protein [Deltaproteobacteria bacterium]|nr:glycosyltransferase family 39 protein [Candidatus Zymogenaceae bacterium]
MEKRWYFYILILALLCTALYFPGLGVRDLWNPNEPNFAEAAREMMASGDYTVPTRNGEPLGMKPAPYYWLIIGSSYITGGLTETAARLPSALFGMLTVLVVFCLARRVMEDEWAFLAALIFATIPRIMWQARWVEADMTLLFFITLCLYLFLRGFESLDDKGKKRLFFILGYAAAAGAVLIKGLVGAVVPAVVIIAYLAVTRDPKKILKMEPILGPIVFLAIALPWYLAAGSHTSSTAGGEGYLYELVIRQNFVRFFSAFNHDEPIYYFIGIFFGDFAPYSLIFPASVVWAFKTRDEMPKGIMSFFLTWFFAVLIFFSLSDSKRTPYIMPLYPAAAVLTAWLVRAWIQDVLDGWYWVKVPAWIISISLAVSVVGCVIFLLNPWGIFSPLYLEAVEHGVGADMIRTMAVPALVLLGVCTAALIVSLARDRRRAWTVALALTLGVVMLYTQLKILPPIDEYKSAKPISEYIAAHLEDEDGFGGYSPDDDFIWYGYMFYTGRYIDLFNTPEDLASYYQRDSRVVVIMRDRYFEELPEDILEEIETVQPFQVGHKEMMLTSNEEL